MIKTIMKCPVCGKEFITKYWEGGYIDHVSNFVDNYKIKLNKLNNLDDIINDLTIHSLNYREEKDIIVLHITKLIATPSFPDGANKPPMSPPQPYPPHIKASPLWLIPNTEPVDTPAIVPPVIEP